MSEVPLYVKYLTRKYICKVYPAPHSGLHREIVAQSTRLSITLAVGTPPMSLLNKFYCSRIGKYFVYDFFAYAIEVKAFPLVAWC